MERMRVELPPRIHIMFLRIGNHSHVDTHVHKNKNILRSASLVF